MSYFQMSKVAWQMTPRPHFPRWLALAFWPTGDLFTHSSNQGTPHHRSETGLNDRKIHKQQVTYPQTPQEYTHGRSSSKDLGQHTGRLRELHFFFPSQLTTDFSDLGCPYSSFSLERSVLFGNCHSSAYKKRGGKVQKSLTGEK